MQAVKAHELVEGLDAPQQKRFARYVKNLATDRDNHFFDDRMAAMIEEYAVNRREVRRVRRYLKEVGYSQSIYQYSQIETQLDRFTKPDHPYFGWNKHYIQAKSALIDEVRRWNLEIVKYYGNESIRRTLPRTDTHAGWNYILTGKRKKGEYLDRAFSEYTSEERKARQVGSFNTPILIGSRTQASGAFDDEGNFTYTFRSKSRLVSMVGLYVILAECRFAKPFQQRLGSVSWYAGGKDDGNISGKLAGMRSTYPYWCSIDYSHYDQSISSWLISDAFDIIKAAFGPVFDAELLKIIQRDFVCKCFLDGHGKVVPARRGVPSGSMFTQIVDSIVNRLVIMTYLNSRGHGKHSYDMMIMGDDNIIFSKEKLDLDDLSSYLSHNFGLEVSPSKSNQATSKTNPKFLSRVWTFGGRWRPDYELLAKLYYPERFRDYEFEEDCASIIHSYVRTFRLGMNELIDVDRFMDEKVAPVRFERSGEWLGGLEYYRLRYA